MTKAEKIKKIKEYKKLMDEKILSREEARLLILSLILLESETENSNEDN